MGIFGCKYMSYLRAQLHEAVKLASAVSNSAYSEIQERNSSGYIACTEDKVYVG